MERITGLSCPALTKEQIKSLETLGIHALIDFISAPKELVCSALELSETEYNNMRKSVLRSIQPQPINFRQVATKEKATPTSTGLEGLDKILGGGLFAGDILEFYGATGCGKTQISLQLTAQVCHFTKPSSTVLYFDMKNDFNATRLLQLCEGSVNSLEKVRVYREANLASLLKKLDEIRSEVVGGINGFYSKCKLLVIDSVPMCMYPVVDDFSGWRFYQEKLLERLNWLANRLNVSVILLNNAVTIRSSTFNDSTSASTSATFSGSTPAAKSALGKYWQHKICLRIQLTKATTGALYKGNLEKCNRTPVNQEFQFSIRKDRINDETGPELLK